MAVYALTRGRDVLAYLRLEVSFLWGGKHICRRDVQMHECLPKGRPVTRLTLPKRKTACASQRVCWRGGAEAVFCVIKHTFYPKNGCISDSLDVLKCKGAVTRMGIY